MAGEWRKFRLGDVCSKIGSGATPRGGSSVYLAEGKCALIRSQNVYNDGFHQDGLIYLTEQHANELANVEVAENDVLLNITGDSVARSCQVTAEILPARVNQHVAIIRSDPTILWPRFLRYYLVSPAMQAWMLSLAGAGATRNALTKGMIESFSAMAPADIAEQRAIAHLLGTLDDKIELNRRMNATLEEMARALFKSWFVDFDPVRAKMEGRDSGLPREIADLFPDRFEAAGEIPAGWEVGRLGDILEQRVERCVASAETAIRPYVPIDCISSKSLFLTDSKPGKEALSSLTRFYEGDLLFGAMRPYFHKVCIAPFNGTTRTRHLCCSRNAERILASQLFCFTTLTLLTSLRGILRAALFPMQAGAVHWWRCRQSFRQAKSATRLMMSSVQSWLEFRNHTSRTEPSLRCATRCCRSLSPATCGYRRPNAFWRKCPYEGRTEARPHQPEQSHWSVERRALRHT